MCVNVSVINSTCFKCVPNTVSTVNQQKNPRLRDKMFKFLVVFCAVMALAAAGGSGDVDDALLARVAQILSENEGAGGGGGSSSGLVDDQLLSRVSQIIAQNEGSSNGGGGGSSGGYSAPSQSYGAPSQSYGAPTRGGSGGGGLSIGRPERAQQVAEFSLSGGGSQGGRSQGGYN